MIRLITRAPKGLPVEITNTYQTFSDTDSSCRVIIWNLHNLKVFYSKFWWVRLLPEIAKFSPYISNQVRRKTNIFF